MTVSARCRPAQSPHDVVAEARRIEADRLAAPEVELDRCWHLLRRRRALQSAGQDGSGATPRSGEQVGNYLS